jgi:DNA-binding NarL/FixJ family response regulator
MSELETPLTRREVEVLTEVAHGSGNKEIAKVLHISVETVKEHVHNILNKLGASGRTQAAVWAVRQGIA